MTQTRKVSGNSRKPRFWRAITGFALVVVVSGGGLLPSPWPGVGAGGVALANPNPFEQKNIEAQALEAFKVIMALWREELYFELYDLGSESTKSRISREEFAQRMVELSFVPYGELNPKHLKSEMSFRTLIYIKARVDYRHKFNTSRRFYRDHIFLLLEEDNTWRVDLIQLIRAPYAK